jgi:outer membrane receptor protein involved in Fe transport
MFNNYLDTTIFNQLPLGLLNPLLAGKYFTFPIHGLGNTNLKEQTLDSYEAGYSGSAVNGRMRMGVTLYLTDSRHDMILGQSASYTSQNPPAGWPLPPSVLDLLVAGNVFGPGFGLPSVLSYQNLGTVRNKGIEANVEARLLRSLNAFANYTYQARPVPKDFDISKINLPPKNRANAGLRFDANRFMGDLTVMYVDTAYFRDVLTYAGWTPSYTQVNTMVGVRFKDGKCTFMAKVNNLGNVAVQNHIFGDLLKRQVSGEMRLRF